MDFKKSIFLYRKNFSDNNKNNGGDNMTSKELTYLEDALSKENFIIEKLNIISSEISDEKISKNLDSVLSIHKKNAKKLEKILMEG